MARRIGITVMTILFLAALVPSVQAEKCSGCKGGPCGPGPGMHEDCRMDCGKHGMPGGTMKEDCGHLWDNLMQLNLDDKQKDGLTAIRGKTMKEMARKQADLQIAHSELRDLLEKDTLDLKAVEAAARKKDGLETEIFMTRIKAHEEMKALLTADQKKKLKEMKAGGHCDGCAKAAGGDCKHHENKHEHMHGK